MQCLRRTSSWPLLTVGSAINRPKLIAPAQLLTCNISGPHARTKTELSKGQQLLEYWQDLLGNLDCTDGPKLSRNHAKTDWKTEDVRDLLHAAVRVRQGRVSGVLPEQLLSTFVQVYQKAMSAEDHLRLFQLLCQDFGVQGKLTTESVCFTATVVQSITLRCYVAEADVNKAIDSWKQAASK